MAEEKLPLIKKYFEKTSEYILNIDDASNDIVKQIISDTKELMFFAKKGITYTQLRNVYKLIKDEAVDFKRIQLIRPKLAYIQARLEKQEGKDFIIMIDDIIEKIDSDPQKSEKQIKNFITFMESIVAYHKLNA